MELRHTAYKNVPAIELKTKRYAALLLPGEGGKMASFRDIRTGKEYLLQNPSETYLHLGMDNDYEQCECSGFDDMFPTLDPVNVKNALGEELQYPDHGEICRLPLTYGISEKGLTLSCESPLLGVHYEKTLTEGEDGAVQIQYAITNPTDTDLDVLWAAHCLVNTQPGGQVLTPFAEGTLIDVLEDTTGAVQAQTRMPCREEFLRTPESVTNPHAAKFYFADPCSKGFVGYRYPAGDTFVITFDGKELPSLGVWVDNGYLSSGCVGLEPCTVGYDTVLAGKAYGQQRLLKAGQTLRFTLTLSVTQT